MDCLLISPGQSEDTLFKAGKGTLTAHHKTVVRQHSVLSGLRRLTPVASGCAIVVNRNSNCAASALGVHFAAKPTKYACRNPKQKVSSAPTTHSTTLAAHVPRLAAASKCCAPLFSGGLGECRLAGIMAAAGRRMSGAIEAGLGSKSPNRSCRKLSRVGSGILTKPYPNITLVFLKGTGDRRSVQAEGTNKLSHLQLVVNWR
ncbi:hypothetical protein RRG08_028860 [Elysia crispata]|uniref:Uncharacterized protein n=1 Tax=Elysia crispata TaxID=231223 RepID=A0AAE0YZ97_9GAST|nr:hypothetical protein RRG08_028860 [Elysia crispata]